MIGGLLLLVAMSSAMAAASFFAGILPLRISLSSGQLRLLSALGTGILVGTALTVVIPEGIEMIYRADESGHPDHVRRSISTTPLTGFIGAEIVGDDGSHRLAARHDQPTGLPSARWTSIPLISGFLLLFLVDAIPKVFSRPRSLFNLPALPLSSLQMPPSAQPSPAPANPSSALSLGLILHSLADGIALGAAVSSSSPSPLTFVLFFAIILHKAPAALSLSALLLRGGASKRTIQNTIAIFSLAAPVGAFLTWLAVGFVSAGARWEGAVMLFSGGTLLFVGCDALLVGHHHAGGPAEPRTLSRTDLLATVAGMLIPSVAMLHPH